jgi:putative transposase
MSRPSRKRLDHTIPKFAEWDATYFLTICCLPRDANTLCETQRASKIFESVQVYESLGKWSVRLMLLMPDHLHVLVDFPFWGDMSRIVGDWRRYLSKRLGITFQRNFFDHRLRRDESHHEKWKYIKMNPVRAGLVKNPEDWPYVYESPGPVSARICFHPNVSIVAAVSSEI